MRIRKRSSCASGSGYVPSYSIGFCVASTMNGRGSGRVSPSVVTWRSCIASSSAACVFGGARLISSASRRLAKIGPGRNVNSLARWSKIDEPVTSDGIRSGVNWMREKSSDVACANERAIIVFARPGIVLEQHVPVAEECEQDQLERVALADDRALDLVEHAACVRREARTSSIRAAPAWTTTSRRAPHRDAGGVAVVRLGPVWAQELPRIVAEQRLRRLGAALQIDVVAGREARRCRLTKHRKQTLV